MAGTKEEQKTCNEELNNVLNSKNEFEQYRFLIDQNVDLTCFLKKRSVISLKYFLQQADKCKKYEKVMMVCNVLLPILAAFFATIAAQFGDVCPGLKILPPLLTASASAVAALVGGFKYGEKKISYRNSAEMMKKELSTFHYETERYEKKNELSADEWKIEKTKLYAKILEEIIESSYKKIVDLEKSSK